MKVVMSGGGSGGHITPLLAVADELKLQHPDCKVYFIGMKGEKVPDIVSDSKSIDEVFYIRAGKFRRYHGESLLSHVLDVKTLLKNARDFVYVGLGYLQSRSLLKHLGPDVIFTRGGFVGVPVGKAAAHLKIPYITHDSDAIPSLANKIIAKDASINAIAMPKELYPYEQSKTVTVGIPISSSFKKVTSEAQKQFKKDLGLNDDEKLIFVTGGGLGADRLNKYVVESFPGLLKMDKSVRLIHNTGPKHEQDVLRLYNSAAEDLVKDGRIKVLGFIKDFYKYSGAADVIVARGGATNLAEFAVQGKACVIVPNPQLTGGHQLKNAKFLKDREAVLVVDEDSVSADPGVLAKSVKNLLDEHETRTKLSNNLSKFAHSSSAKEIVELINKTAKP